MSIAKRIFAVFGLELLCLLMIGYASFSGVEARAIQVRTELETQNLIIAYTSPQPETGSNSEVWTMSLDGLNQTQLTTRLGDDRLSAIAPDGSRIAYVSWEAGGSTTLWMMNHAGSNPTPIPTGGNTQRLAWSPTGSQLAITNDAEDWWEVWLVNPDGTNLHRLTTTGAAAGNPSWSPDGQKIIFTVDPAPGYVDLYLINSDGTGQALFVSASGTGISHHLPAWSPDGTQIATIHSPAGSAGPYNLWVMNTTGLTETEIVTDVTQPNLNRISWSPDGNWLVFAKDGQIWRVQRDGTELTQVTTTGGWEPSIGPIVAMTLIPNRSGIGFPAGVTVYTHTLTNFGAADRYTLTTRSSNGWPINPDPPFTITLSSSQSTVITASINVPAGILSGTVETTIISATSWTDPLMSAVVTDTTVIGHVPGVALAPDRDSVTPPATVIVYQHTLTNTGNAADTFDLSHHSLQSWDVAYSTPLSLNAGQTATVMLSLTVPAGVISSTLDATSITATSRADINQSARVTDTTLIVQVADLAFSPDHNGSVDSGRTIAYQHTLTNTGNGDDVFDLAHLSSQGWTVQYNAPISLGAGQAATVVINVTVPTGVISGTMDTTIITATSRTNISQFAFVTDVTLSTKMYSLYLPLLMK